jgi:Heat induced stress protein YflT domain
MVDPVDAATHAGGPGVPDQEPVTVATYEDYLSAQRAVDHLSDKGFPVEQLSIVGTGVRLVETVLGRLTTGRAAATGAVSGAWLGLFLGLLLTVFTSSAWWAVFLVAIALGAVWGAVFGGVAHAMTGGRRDFSSVSSLVANSYRITVPADLAERARDLLNELASTAD